jgi:F-type H+-transporting ATPase subunit beta
MAQVGKVIQIIGPVVDCQFEEGHLPLIHNGVVIEGDAGGRAGRVTTEVQQHLGESRVRCVSMQPTDGLVRGMKATDTGEPITVPVGKETLGRVMNVIGEPVDEKGPIEAAKRYPIHRPAPSFDDQSTETRMLETGIKVIDLLEPYGLGGMIGLFGGAGVGQPVVEPRSSGTSLRSHGPVSGMDQFPLLWDRGASATSLAGIILSQLLTGQQELYENHRVNL